MDETVARAMAKWPNVPAVRGWLSLDRRGEWRLKGEPISNRAMIDFIARNYGCDSCGRWFFQNGPQRVFVDLAYTPWVYSLDGRGALVTHTGLAGGAVEKAWIDEAGALVLAGEPGPGVVDNRDLATLSDQLCDASGAPIDDDLVAAFVASPPGSEPELRLAYGGTRVRVGRIESDDLAASLGFVPRPGPDSP